MLKRITNNKRKIVPNLIPKSKLVMRGNHCKQSEPKPLFPQLMRKKIEFSISLTAYFKNDFSLLRVYRQNEVKIVFYILHLCTKTYFYEAI